MELRGKCYTPWDHHRIGKAGARALAGSMSVIAFHEKAGRSQESFFLVLLDKVFLSSRVSHCRHASIRTLCERSFARCILGVLVTAGAAICLAPCRFTYK